jgi:protein-tyrosine phosphatase
MSTPARPGPAGSRETYGPRVRILFVCTGNLCRSAVAERLTRSLASRVLAHSPELDRVEVVSAGIHAEDGERMHPRSARALEALGGSASGFRSQRLTGELAASADLVLTMTRDQRAAALGVNPRGLHRTFTLAEAADLVRLADLSRLELMPLDARAAEFGRRLNAARSCRLVSPADDISDPMGQRAAVHAEVAACIERTLRPLADVLFPSVRRQLAAPVPA